MFRSLSPRVFSVCVWLSINNLKWSGILGLMNYILQPLGELSFELIINVFSVFSVWVWIIQKFELLQNALFFFRHFRFSFVSLARPFHIAYLHSDARYAPDWNVLSNSKSVSDVVKESFTITIRTNIYDSRLQIGW